MDYEPATINANSLSFNLGRTGFDLQLIRAEISDKCDPNRFQTRAVTTN